MGREGLGGEGTSPSDAVKSWVNSLIGLHASWEHTELSRWHYEYARHSGWKYSVFVYRGSPVDLDSCRDLGGGCM